ncbi:MAG: enolase C-terminal domain-like protein [Verrucomicrobiota bacterium]
MKTSDIRCIGATLYYLPVYTRVPLKFGTETVTYVTCARVKATVQDRAGKTAAGWGETPLSVTWVWPSTLPYETRHAALKKFTELLGAELVKYAEPGHPIELSNDFQEHVLPGLLKKFNDSRTGEEPMPWLAALVCFSLYDIALHDAYGNLLGLPVYETYGPAYMNRTLEQLLTPAEDTKVSFQGLYPQDFFAKTRPDKLPAWHLVGGLDLLTDADRKGTEPNDGYPVVLTEWIKRDGLKCLKIKLKGNDAAWDYARTVAIGKIAVEQGVDWLTADFNCTVLDPAYVNDILDRLRDEYPRYYGMILYVEQPFPYELEKDRIDTHSLSARKPLFLDESAHDWKHVKLGRELGWTGVALKTCKTQSGAILSACWAKAHGMTLMVQDLTNPMLAQVPHVQLAAFVGTIMGVETNAMQFYPEASSIEAKVHPGIYQRRNGGLDLSTIKGSGFGYRLNEIVRELPAPAATF